MSKAHQTVIYVSTMHNDRPLPELNEELIRESRADYGIVYENGTQVRRKNQCFAGFLYSL